MKVIIFHESGEQAALYGLGLSFGVTSNIDPVDFMYTTLHEGVANRLLMRARRLSGLGNGHDKFLRMLRVDLLITAPLYWWKQFDTYKVGTVTQSESTMHTLMKSPITQNMFESGLHPDILNILENMRLAGNFDGLNNLLPHSFLQTRMVSTNYAVLQNIIRQRRGHKLREWREFISTILGQCNHPDLLWPDRLADAEDPDGTEDEGKDDTMPDRLRKS